eukprot:g9456.t1
MTMTPQSDVSGNQSMRSTTFDSESVMAHASDTSHDKIDLQHAINTDNASSSAMTTASNWSANTQSIIQTIPSRASTVEVEIMQASFKTSKSSPHSKDRYLKQGTSVDENGNTGDHAEQTPVLLLEDSNDNIKSYTETRKIEPLEADEFNAKPNLLLKLELFLKNELDKVEGKSFKRMCQEHRHDTPQKKGAPPILKKGELPLLTTNARLQAYRQAFHIYMLDSRQRKYHTFLTDVAREYNNALERAEMCIQAVPEMRSQIGSAREEMENRMKKLKDGSKRVIEKLNGDLEKERATYQIDIKKKNLEVLDLRNKLATMEEENKMLYSQREQLISTQKTLLGFLTKWAQWRADGKANAIYAGTQYGSMGSPLNQGGPSSDPASSLSMYAEDEDENPEETSEQKAFRIQEKLSRQEWKGVHDTLASITKTHANVMSDTEKLSKLHASQMSRAKSTILMMLDKLEHAAKQGVKFDGIEFHETEANTNVESNNVDKHEKPKIIDRKLKKKLEEDMGGSLDILQQILSKRPFPIEVIRMRERKELEDKARKIRNIKRGMKAPGKSPIRAKKLNATRPGKKTTIVRASPLARRAKKASRRARNGLLDLERHG